MEVVLRIRMTHRNPFHQQFQILSLRQKIKQRRQMLINYQKIGSQESTRPSIFRFANVACNRPAKNYKIFVFQQIMGRIAATIVLSLLLSLCNTTTLTVLDPPEQASRFREPIQMHVSPIGFRPLSGRLEGKAILADPFGACTMITDAHSSDEDLFVMADDSKCLESVKAKNIANSGAYVGIIRQNIDNTLHDKEVNLVHIPIIELPPESFDALALAIRESTVSLTLSLDFTERGLTHQVNLEVWFSPTERQTYAFILEMREFILSMGEDLSFAPHYVLQSQRDTKKYIGCYSSGRYCPSQIEFQGKYEGINIVDESLRQIIIWKMSRTLWWFYFQNFYENCLLPNPDIFSSKPQLDKCAENAMLMSQIDLQRFRKQYNGSFVGSQKEVADNTYLLEERQHYLREQLSSHPTALINKKQINLNIVQVKERICKIHGEQQGGPCHQTHGLSTIQILILISVVFVVFVAITALYRLFIYLRMKKEIKTEVDRTLEQYYRYIQTFQEDGGICSKKKQSNKQISRPLTDQLDEMEKKRQIEVEMSQLRK